MIDPDKKNNEPEAIAHILQRWLKESNIQTNFQKYQIYKLWDQVVPKKYREHTRPCQWQDKILDIQVDSQICYFEMKNFYRPELLKKIQSISKQYIKDIRFILVPKF